MTEDLKAKIGTPEEVFWTGVKEKCETDILGAKREIEINEHIIKLAEEKIKREQKFK